jgi:ABC-type dipeptide/oligopeptide/nickel transport system permease component/ABC-type transport system substrate-binding protein
MTRHFWAILIAMGMILAVPAIAWARDSVVLGTQLEPPGLDPTASASAAIGELTFPTVYEALVHLGPGGTVEPGLAVSWDVAPDGLAYRFHLRSGVHFHDGSVMDAAAVQFSLMRAIAPASLNPQKAMLNVIGSVEIVDPLTVTLHLTRPSSSLLQVLGWSAAAILSPASASQDASHPVGTGPFRFEAWRRGDSLSLVRNPDYWGATPHLARVTFRFIADPSAALDALMAGDVDGFSAFPAPESMRRLAADPRFHVDIAPSEAKTIMSINNRQKPFDDVRVRQALSYAVDRQAIIDAAMFGYGTPIGSHFAPQDAGYVDLTDRYPYDPAMARSLLAEAGYPHGFHATLKLPPLSYALRSGEIVAAELANVGISVDIVSMEWVPWLDQVFGHHDFDMTIVAHVEPMDYGIYARDDYYFGYAAPRFKTLVASVDAAQDPATRLRLLGDVQRMIADDAVNVFLFDFPAFGVWDARLKDLAYRTPVQGFDLVTAHFDTAEAGSVGNTGTDKGRSVSLVIVAVGAVGLGLLFRQAGLYYAVRRFASMLMTLLAASIVIFAVIQLAPGDPARFALGMHADPAALAALRSQLGLDRPVISRYVIWLAGLIRGDLGESWTYHLPVRSLILQRLDVSLPLTLYAVLLSTALALVTGFAAVAARRRRIGRLLGLVTQIGIAVPNFWLGLLLVSVFGVGLRWFSAGGFAGWDAGIVAAVKSLTLPAIALAVPQAAILARVLRAELLENLGQDYMRTARAKGLSETQALLWHALPNSLLPVLTVLGMQFSFLLAGAVIIENVFFLPGLGRLVFEAIAQRDLAVVSGVSIVLVFQVIVIMLAADLCCAAVDPRLREARA